MNNPIVNELIPIKNSLKQSVKFQQISDLILEKIKVIPNILDHKTNIELINLICNIIEYFCKKKYKIDKANLLLYTLKRVIPTLTSDEEEVIKNTIEYLHDNKLILSISTFKYSMTYLKNFFLKKAPVPASSPNSSPIS